MKKKTAKVYVDNKTYDIEDGENAREKAISKSHITWFLTFVNPDDEILYLISLKNSFYFPTFWPIIIIFIAFLISQGTDDPYATINDGFLVSSVVADVLSLLLTIFFTLSQFFDYFHNYLPQFFYAFSKYYLRKFLRGHVEDLILLLLSLAQGLYQLSLVSRNLCVGCAKVFSVESCNDSQASKYFPLDQAMVGYVSILVLPIYFKSMSRHVVLLAWLELTILIIAAHLYGEYYFQPFTIVFCLFFFVTICEYERSKMTSYLLSKEALSLEKNKLMIMQEKSKIIERKLHMALVHQILPPKVAEQIIAGKTVAPEAFEEVTIFFSDVEGFTTICSQVTPVEVVRMLNDLYTVMDYCTSLFPVYKVETIGDAYMLVGGLPVRDPNHYQHIADFALLVQTAVREVKSPIDGSPIRIRIGLHSGSVIAGVVGNLMPRYCLFGDTVNTASRMESNGSPGLIHCSEKVAMLLMKGNKHRLAKRGEIEVKGKGLMTTYWLESATDDNKNANSEAIMKCQSMVQEVLLSAHDGDTNHQGSGKTHQNGNNGETMHSTQHSQNGNTGNGEGNEVMSSMSPRVYSEETLNGTVGNGSSSSNNDNPQPTASRSEHNHTQGAGQGQHPSSLSHATSRHTLRTHRISDGSKAIDSAGAKILVVEDSAAQRKLLLKKLAEADPSWDLSYAVSGEDALQKLKAAKFAYDVVFVDENLSINDGLYGHELVQVMRESFHMKHTVIIACTGNPAKVGKELMDAGVDFVWPKPPPMPTVIKMKINMLLESRIKQNNQQAANANSNVPTSPTNRGTQNNSSGSNAAGAMSPSPEKQQEKPERSMHFNLSRFTGGGGGGASANASSTNDMRSMAVANSNGNSGNNNGNANASSSMSKYMPSLRIGTIHHEGDEKSS